MRNRILFHNEIDVFLSGKPIYFFGCFLLVVVAILIHWENSSADMSIGTIIKQNAQWLLIKNFEANREYTRLPFYSIMDYPAAAVFFHNKLDFDLGLY